MRKGGEILLLSCLLEKLSPLFSIAELTAWKCFKPSRGNHLSPSWCYEPLFGAQLFFDIFMVLSCNQSGYLVFCILFSQQVRGKRIIMHHHFLTSFSFLFQCWAAFTNVLVSVPKGILQWSAQTILTKSCKLKFARCSFKERKKDCLFHMEIFSFPERKKKIGKVKQ